MKAVQVKQHGGPEVLTYESIPAGQPDPGQIKVRNAAIGLNFTDIYFRTGAYNPGKLPFIPGNEGAGEVVEVGEGVTNFKPGDRVAYVTLLGAYAEEAIVPAQYTAHLPDGITFEAAAATMLKGLTAHYLLRQTFKVEAGHTILVHAAAGGVGTIVTQWAKHIGAKVIGTVGSQAKLKLAQNNGCDYVINYTEEDVAKRVKEITASVGCDVVYDSVGKATFMGSINSLRPRGYLVSFGSASGPVENVDLSLLAQKGSLFVTSPVLFDYLEGKDDVSTMSTELFKLISSGAITFSSPTKVRLAEAAKAHTLLEGRQTTGATVLVP